MAPPAAKYASAASGRAANNREAPAPMKKIMLVSFSPTAAPISNPATRVACRTLRVRRQNQAETPDNRQRREHIGEAGPDLGQRHWAERGDHDRGRERPSACRAADNHPREPINQRQVEAVDRAQYRSPERCADIMPQQISRDIGERIQEGLKAAGRDILIESSIDQGEGTILVIISPIPVDVFAGKPGVGSAGQQRPRDHNPGLQPCLEAFARDHQSNDSRMVSFDTGGKNPPG